MTCAAVQLVNLGESVGLCCPDRQGEFIRWPGFQDREESRSVSSLCTVREGGPGFEREHLCFTLDVAAPGSQEGMQRWGVFCISLDHLYVWLRYTDIIFLHTVFYAWFLLVSGETERQAHFPICSSVPHSSRFCCLSELVACTVIIVEYGKCQHLWFSCIVYHFWYRRHYSDFSC